MGIFSTLGKILGLSRPVEASDLDDFHLTDRARAHLKALTDGHTLNVATAPADRGRVVRVQEGPPLASLHETLRSVITQADVERLRGLSLDWLDQRWTVVLKLRLDASETPNPNGRMYTVDRVLNLGPPRFFVAGTAAPDLPQRLLEIDGVKSVLLRDRHVTVERRPNTPWKVIDRAVDAALREHFLLCGTALSEEPTSTQHTGLEARIAEVLRTQIAPMVHKDGGDIEFLSFQDGIVRVHMVGACRSCPAATTTLKLGVEATLKREFPGQVHSVEQIG